MKRLMILLFAIAVSFPAISFETAYSDSWGTHGFSVESQTSSEVIVNFSVHSFAVTDVMIDGDWMHGIIFPGVFLPNDEGAPNLPGLGRYLAVPQGSTAIMEVLDYRTESFDNVEVAPAPRIPWDTETGPLQYRKDDAVYGRNSFYPEQPFLLSEKDDIRGVDVVMLGITPFQYNPATKELLVYRDVRIRVTFQGGNGHFGDDRLRSRWWDPIHHDAILNHASLPVVNYDWMYSKSREDGCEYLIISPDGADFVAWADSIKLFREKQGIITKVVTVTEIGGNNANTIKNYIHNAYNTWTIPPAAILILADYGTSAANSVISPIYNSYCVSDNIYVDVTGNNLPNMAHARITAQNAAQLETMVKKFLDYETSPPVNQHYYKHPITAMGWQTERWFQLCSETINGFWEHSLGKKPKRENNIYSGTPGTVWSTAPNTAQVVAYFGPNYMGYIPATPQHLTDWNGSATRINNNINAGAFMIQHRDHGFEQGWGEPDYGNSHLAGLDNDDLTYVLSVNCLTGKYNISGTCFAEAFHRHQKGALGLIAASEVSYSFVNDAYVWGLFDNLWPGFMPDYGTNPPSRDILPAFGNAAGKHFLQQSAWPYNTSNKIVTYHLFHHHGDAFSTVYTEMPEYLTVLHCNEMLSNATVFPVLADEGALIGLWANGAVIGTATGTGDYVDVTVIPQAPGTMVEVTVTKQNHFRYSSVVDVIDANTPYVVYTSFTLNDNAGNGNGQLEYGESVLLGLSMENIGLLQATNVNVELSTVDPFVTITDNSENFGTIQAGATVNKVDAFAFEVDGQVPDGQKIVFDVAAVSSSNTWMSQFLIMAHAPTFSIADFAVSDPGGNNNGRLDPGETVDMVITLSNTGSVAANSVVAVLSCNSSYITVNQSSQNYGTIDPDSEIEKSYSVSVDPQAPQGATINFTVEISGANGAGGLLTFTSFIGKFPVLVLDLDPKNYSGPNLYATFDDLDIYADYMISFPDDLGLYKNVFVCLGIKFDNHELTEAEGQKLKDFLLEGGNLYMEGRITWFDDPPTPVHSMFGIETEALSYYQITDVLGIPGTFTNGMEFPYQGNLAVSNYAFNPISTAYTIFETETSENSAVVAYDAEDYRTIGSFIEFGQLADGAHPSTKKELMQRILNFFDGIILGDEETRTPYGTEDLSCFPNPFSGQTTIQFHLEKEAKVTLEIYDQRGKLVASPVKESHLQNGIHSVTWDVGNQKGGLPAGLYFCKLKTDHKTSIVKLIKGK